MKNIGYALSPFIFAILVFLVVYLGIYFFRDNDARLLKAFDNCMYVYDNREYCIKEYEAKLKESK